MFKRSANLIDLTERVEPPKRVKDSEPPLSESQRRALHYVTAGNSVFITGGAGTGKSFLIDRIRSELLKLKRPYYVTATTGSAAYNIGGITIHSYAAVGLGTGEAKKMASDLMRFKKAKASRWCWTKTLIIDEVSMLADDFFEKLDIIAKEVRQRRFEPFGGIQLVLVGDFLQLPPIYKNKDASSKRYIFETEAWRALNPILVRLDTNFRQKSDEVFRQLLSSVRLGRLATQDLTLLEERSKQELPAQATKLFSLRKDVQRVNEEEMAKLEGESHFYEAQIWNAAVKNGQQQEKGATTTTTGAQSSYPVDEHIELKVGASVLLCCNMDVESGLYNGSRGEVIDFQSEFLPSGYDKELAMKTGNLKHLSVKLYPLVRFSNGVEQLITPHCWEQREKEEVVASFTQIPLLLRYAISIHKSQGLTLESAQVEMSFFETGQAYVALSRVRNLEDLYLTNFNDYSKKKIMADQRVVKFYEDHQLL